MQKSNKPFKGYVYKIINSQNGKFYIGQTRRTPLARFKDHLKCSDHSTKYRSHLYEAIRKYGKESFYIEVLEAVNTSLEELYSREKHWILKLDATNPNVGYNIDLGGRGGDITHLLPEETQKEIKNKLRNRGLGRKQTKETVEKRASKTRGRKVIHKGIKILRVQPEELSKYLEQGWQLGTPPEITKRATQWQKDPIKRAAANKKLAEATKGKLKGYIRLVNTQNQRVCVSKESSDYYIKKGYTRGFGETARHKHKNKE